MLAFIIPILIAISCAMAAPAEQTEFSQSLGQFSNDLYEQLAERDGNVIYSPYSVAAALALASVGSKGQTFDEIKRGLHLTGDQSAIADQFSTSQTELTKNAGNVQLDVANRLYVKNGYSLNANFEEIAAKKFNSGIESVNFLENVKTAGVINQWVEQKTHDKIKDLIKADTLDGDTRVILVNAIYFKGPWKHQFNKDQTKKEKFWTGQDTSVDVDMMHVKENFKYADLNELDAVAVELPYNNSDISMLVILPKSRTGLKDLEAKLKNTNLADITGKMYTSEVEVSMPKFHCEFEASLVEPLKKLGFTSMFANADFSNMLTSPEPLTVSDVVHKAFIDVNEEGAEAAAATGTIFMTRSGRITFLPVEPFIADHPYIYTILSKKNVLFVGAQKKF